MRLMRGWIFNVGGLGALVAGMAAVAACGVGSDCDFGLCAGPSVGSGDGGGAGDGGDAQTDPCIDAPTNATCLNESAAWFVSSATGDDTAADGGTRAKPFKTIGAALAKLSGEKRRVYICAGTYAEDVALGASHSGVSLFGGVDCEWRAAPGQKPVIGASANPVKIDGATRVAISDLAVEAKDAVTGSSVAVFVNGG